MADVESWNAACEANALAIEAAGRKKFWPTAAKDHAAICRGAKRPVPTLIGQEPQPRHSTEEDRPQGAD